MPRSGARSSGGCWWPRRPRSSSSPRSTPSSAAGRRRVKVSIPTDLLHEKGTGVMDSVNEIDPNDVPYLLETREARRGRSRTGATRVLGGLGLGAVVVLSLGVAGKLSQRAALAETASAQDQAPVVNVVRAHRPTTVPAVVLPATVEPMQETTIYARTSGYLKSV